MGDGDAVTAVVVDAPPQTGLDFSASDFGARTDLGDHVRLYLVVDGHEEGAWIRAVELLDHFVGWGCEQRDLETLWAQELLAMRVLKSPSPRG